MWLSDIWHTFKFCKMVISGFFSLVFCFFFYKQEWAFIKWNVLSKQSDINIQERRFFLGFFKLLFYFFFLTTFSFTLIYNYIKPNVNVLDRSFFFYSLLSSTQKHRSFYTQNALNPLRYTPLTNDDQPPCYTTWEFPLEMAAPWEKLFGSYRMKETETLFWFCFFCFKAVWASSCDVVWRWTDTLPQKVTSFSPDPNLQVS